MFNGQRTDGIVSSIARLRKKYYRALPHLKSPLEHEVLVNTVSEMAHRQPEDIHFGVDYAQRMTETRNRIARWLKEEIPGLEEETRLRLATIAAHKTSILAPFLPLIIDDLVEDIYLDHPSSTIYFDHRFMGRVETSIVVDDRLASRLATLLRLESNNHLDRCNPSLKTNFVIEDIQLRISATIPPLSPDGLHLEIRRAKRQPLTLMDLVKNGTMPLRLAAVLLLAYSSRMNITIVGEPGSGKTTLLRALDMCSPTSWRKIYIEDAIESRLSPSFHQIRFSVEPTDERNRAFSKSDEIVKTLHRAPDYVILGEIQTSEHSQSLFRSLLAGLRSIQTCHSSSIHALITRWRFDHNISDSAIALMDLLIMLRRSAPAHSRRFVSEVMEIRRSYHKGRLLFEGTSTIYEHQSGLRSPADWADDGAMWEMARLYGATDIEEVLDAIVRLQESVGRVTPLDTSIGDILWSNGHPFRFTLHPELLE